jgi:hypothetical protein
MKWSDLEFAWKHQPLPLGAAADIADIRRTFEDKRRRLHRGLLIRDLSEAATGVLICAFLAWAWAKIGRDAWPFGISIALTLGVSAFFCIDRIRAHRSRVGADAPLAAKVADQLSELRHQRRLLFNIGVWYIGPIFLSWVFIAVAMGLHSERVAPGLLSDLMRNAATAGYILLYVVVIVPLCFWGTWYANRRVVLKRIDPRIAELEKLQRELTP